MATKEIPLPRDIPTDSFSVLIADDHPLYRDALGSLIKRAPDLCLAGAAANFSEALMMLANIPCDLVLLDLMMPGMTGTQGLYKVHHLRPEAKIVLISGQMDRAIVTDGLAVGAVGFLSKACTPDTILAALRLVLTGATYVPSDLMWSESPRPTPHNAGKGLKPATDEATLNDREINVLNRLAEGASHKEIGRELGLAEVTIKLHTQRIVRKLGVKNRAAAIAMAVRDGLIHH
jgi:DNA-binding NarL/FixJ family response regulator